ncbi:ISGsu4, transposase, partial [mine drainage metagenome]
LKHGDDHSDAVHLAQLMRPGLLPEGYIYPREQRATRDLLRRRGIGPGGEAMPGTEGLSCMRRALHDAAPCLSAHSCRVAIG